MNDQVLGLIGLALLLAAIFIGFPIAFTLGAVAIIIGFIALGPVVFDLAILQTLSVMQDSILASIPFFLFMGFFAGAIGIDGAIISFNSTIIFRCSRISLPSRYHHCNYFCCRNWNCWFFRHIIGSYGSALDD